MNGTHWPDGTVLEIRDARSGEITGRLTVVDHFDCPLGEEILAGELEHGPEEDVLIFERHDGAFVLIAPDYLDELAQPVHFTRIDA